MSTSPTREPWRPSGLVTLLTDFGLRDTYVGVMKGVLFRDAPALRAAVDLTHAVPPQDVRSAAFHLGQAWRWFPAGTVHVAVVDPGVGSGRRILVARQDGHAFLAPDNGLLDPLLGPDASVRALDVARHALSPGRRPSRTFHGRDVFAPVAARLASGLDPDEAGPPAGERVRLELAPPEDRGAEGIRGCVVCVDHFGNLVTNLPRELLAGGAGRWELEAAGRRAPLVGTYAEAERGELLALVDSYELVELAVRDGSAAERLGLGTGAPVRAVRRGAES